jgi:hypothetical protein
MKNSSLTSKLLAAALTLGVLAYFGVQIYRYVDDPFSTTLVYSYRVEDTLDISGYMVRQEQVLTGESGGLMRLQKNEGERDNQISRTLLDYRAALAAGRLDAAEGRGQELRSLVLKRDYTYSGTEDLSGQISELKTQLQTLRKQAASSVKTIKSPRSGLFSAVVDGYESVLTPESLDTLTPSGLDTLTAGEIPANTGKLILGDSWYYAGTLSAKDAETLKNRSSHMTGSERLYLRFTKNVDRDLEVELVSIGQEENGRCVAVFRGNTYLQELTLLRRQSAEIVLDSTDGIRVPRAALRSAVREVTETDPETEEETTKQVSVTGVYCVSGAKAVFKPVEVLYTGEDYAVVRTTADAEAEKLRLRPGDEVIVAARDLYDGKVITSS